MRRLSFLLKSPFVRALGLVVLMVFIADGVMANVHPGAGPAAVALPHVPSVGRALPAPTASGTGVPGLQALATPSAASPTGIIPGSGCAPGAPGEDSWANNVSVTFSTGPLNILPAPNLINEFDDYVKITVTTTYPGMDIAEAYMTVWAVGWNGAVLSSTEPSDPAVWTFTNNSQNYQQATGQLNNFKYFPPGSTVYFNLTLVQESALGANWLYSPCPVGPLPSTKGLTAQPTWEYTLGGGWPSTNFANDINISASPNIFAGVEPSSNQAVLLYLNSSYLSGFPIGGANLYYNLTNTTGTYPGGWSFAPRNSTYEYLTDYVGIGPFLPGDTISFYIKAWVLWGETGAVNYITSTKYSYTVSYGGTWCNPAPGFSHYISLNSTPANITQNPLNNTLVPAFTEVNLTILSKNPNTTIAYAYVFFNETYEGTPESGDLLMSHINSTAEYTGEVSQQPFDPSALPPMEPGMDFSFYIIAFDSLKCEVKSPIYHFHTARGNPPTVNDETYFYVVVEDASQGRFVPGVAVNISNTTWTVLTQTNLLGFAYPNLTDSDVPAFLHYGYYNVTVTYKGAVQQVDYDMTPTSNKTLTFVFNPTTSSPPVYAAAAPVDSIGLYFGLAAAALAVVPIYGMWREQRRKAEAEEKRITL